MRESARKPNMPSRLRLIPAALVALLLGLGSASCSVWGTNVVRVSGSTTLLPLVQEGADRYMDLHPGKTVLVQGGGSSAGIAQVKEGIVDIANSSRDLKPEEDDGRLADHPIAIDVIVIIVHPEVPLNGLTSGQARDIFAGRVTNWAEVGGEDAPILVVVRDRASGTREMFDDRVLGGGEVTGAAIESNSNGIVRETVAATPNSIGYISTGYLNASVKPLSYDGVLPTGDNAMSGAYALSRYLRMYTCGEPAPAAREFLAYVLSEEFQLGVVAEEYLPVIKPEDI